MSRDSFNRDPHYLKALVVHLTTVRHVQGPYPWEIEIARGTAGLSERSTAKCNEVYTVFKRDFDSRIGSLPAHVLASVDGALALVLGLPAPAASARPAND